MNFKHCKNIKSLSNTLDDWYGLVCQTDLPKSDAYLKLMLINVLPDDMQITVHNRLQYDLDTAETIFEFAKYQCGLIRSKEITGHDNTKNIHSLVKQAENILQQLADRGDTTFANAIQQVAPGASSPGRRPPPPPRRGAPRPGRAPSRAATPGSRAPSPGGRRPPLQIAKDYNFKGCWHCGEPDHARGACDAFKDLLNANDNKLPTGYKGEYEKWLEAGKPYRPQNSINDLTAQAERAEDSEDDDTEQGSTCSMLWTAAKPGLKPRTIAAVTKPTSTKNSFTQLANNDTTTDAPNTNETLKETCNTWAHSVNPTTNDKHKRQKRADNTINMNITSETDIDRLVAWIKQKNGKADLASVAKEMPRTKDGKHLLACVDSGSVTTVLDAEKELHGHPILPSKSQRQGLNYVGANGGKIANEGKVKVNIKTTNGVRLTDVTFQNAKVKMPILSVRRIVRKGSRVEFFVGGGVIHLPDGQKIDFVERFGVYFVHLIVEPPDGSYDLDGKPLQVFSGRGA